MVFRLSYYVLNLCAQLWKNLLILLLNCYFEFFGLICKYLEEISHLIKSVIKLILSVWIDVHHKCFSF